jgi:hypothetical protein
MSEPKVPALLQRFVDDELLRAPLLFDQVVEGSLERLREQLPTLHPGPRAMVADLIQSLTGLRRRLREHFVSSLREQAQDDPNWHVPKPEVQARDPRSLALVDEDEVSMDVEVLHTIESIKSRCEHELRELATYTSALVGDMDVARDHNPFRAETYARALAEACSKVSVQAAQQTTLMRHASEVLAQLLRKSYAAASSRLESQGVQQAAYRTVILPSGARRGNRFGETTFSPEMHRMLDSMPAPLQMVPPTGHSPLEALRVPMPEGITAAAASRPDWRSLINATHSRAERQAVELVHRLFEAMLVDDRVPADARPIVAALHQPALAMTLRNPSLLEEDKHPLWRFINRLVFEAQMTPDPRDPDRLLLLKTASVTVEQLAGEAVQEVRLYQWAMERLESFLKRRFMRRLAAVSSQIGALQKLEDKLAAGDDTPSTLQGTLDVMQLDTVPAELMDDSPAPMPGSRADAETWLESLAPGDWVRLFLQGRWVHAALLWPGERREVWLFVDGGSDATWAVRRNALLLLHDTKLAKKLKQRSIVGSAAARVQEQMGGSQAA